MAITVANALAYTSPVYEKSQIRTRQQHWDKFMKGLDWDFISSKGKQADPKSVVKSLSKIGIPINIKKRDDLSGI